jgi:hypothetical protein
VRIARRFTARVRMLHLARCCRATDPRGRAPNALAASEMDVVTLVDVSMLLLPPASGDELQVPRARIIMVLLRFATSGAEEG